jgi:hypothetical protein
MRLTWYHHQKYIPNDSNKIKDFLYTILLPEGIHIVLSFFGEFPGQFFL